MSASSSLRRSLLVLLVLACVPVTAAGAQAAADLARRDSQLALRFEAPRDADRLAADRATYKHPFADSALVFGSRLPIGSGDVTEVRVVPAAGRGAFTVLVMLTSDGAARLRQSTAAAAGRRMGIIVGGELVALTRVSSPLGSRMLPLATDLSAERARHIARQLEVRR